MKRPDLAPKPAVPSAIRELIMVLPIPVQELALTARGFLIAALPDAIEIPDLKAKLVGYGYGAGYKDMVATLLLSKAGVKIGLAQGASLPDPTSLLHGAGKVHRYIEVRTQEQLRQAAVTQLVEAALSAWQRRSEEAKRNRIGKSANRP